MHAGLRLSRQSTLRMPAHSSEHRIARGTNHSQTYDHGEESIKLKNNWSVYSKKADMSLFTRSNSCRAMTLALLCASSAWGQESVATIIQRSVEANERDWRAVPEFDYTERVKEGDGDKTNAVTMLYGSPYERLIAVNGHPLNGEKEREEQRKYERVAAQRRGESADKRAARISKYEAERKRDHTLLDQMTKAFDFKLVGDDDLKGRKVYVLKATPRSGYRPPNRDSHVLPGMEGTLWIDHESFQWVKVEAHVTRPVRIEGFLAEVEPGTQFELEKVPVAPDIWVATHFAMKSNARVMMVFPHRSQQDITYSSYHRGNEAASRRESSSSK